MSAPRLSHEDSPDLATLSPYSELLARCHLLLDHFTTAATPVNATSSRAARLLELQYSEWRGCRGWGVRRGVKGSMKVVPHLAC
jgi:hypothetical protein